MIQFTGIRHIDRDEEIFGLERIYLCNYKGRFFVSKFIFNTFTLFDDIGKRECHRDELTELYQLYTKDI